jgi:phage-related protein
METVRKLIFFRHYFHDFFESLPEKVKEKMDEVLFVVSVAERIPQKFFKHIEGTRGLYEIRVEWQSNIYRVFCCFDEGKIIVLFHGFQKKTQKTPLKEIEKAMRIMDEYFQSIKKKDNGR